jgi:uncharacterized protein YegJ (DUF2314 family)
MKHAAALFAAFLAGAAPAVAEREPDPVMSFSADDPTMNAAIATARKSLPLFLDTTLDADGFRSDAGHLKVSFPVDHADMDTEITWVGPFRRLSDDDFVGLLANEPVAMPGLHVGDAVSFRYDSIVDWNLESGDGRYWGDYTTRVVVGRLPASEAAASKGRFLDPPVPSDWTRE